jgi:DNA replication regulator SLD3
MSRPASRLENRPDHRAESRFDARFETRPSSRPSSRASARPSSTAGIFTPANGADLNRSRTQSRHSLPAPDSASPASGKRKRDVAGVGADGLLKAAIVIKVCLWSRSPPDGERE